MHVYERSKEIAAPADRVFAFLRDPGNLSVYVTPLDSARLVDDEGRVDLTARTPEDGVPIHGSGRLHVDEGARRLTWEARTSRVYSGRAEVADLGEGRSRLDVHLEFGEPDATHEVATGNPPPRERTSAMERNETEHDPIDRALGAAVEMIRRELEGKGQGAVPTLERPT